MCKLVAKLWSHQEVVTGQKGYHGPNFMAIKGTTQGGIISPTLFKVAKNDVTTRSTTVRGV